MRDDALVALRPFMVIAPLKQYSVTLPYLGGICLIVISGKYKVCKILLCITAIQLPD